MVKEIAIIRAGPPGSSRRDDEFVDLPFPSRSMIAIPFGTLLHEGHDENRQPLYGLERGVPVLPSVGDPVLLPTSLQLRSIVEAKVGDRLIQIGTAPFAGNARVWVHPDKLFGRHLAVLGNTASGKSCSVAGIIRWSLEATMSGVAGGTAQTSPNARFIILDPNGEYAAAFKDGVLPARHYAVGGSGGTRPLTVPGWLWTGQEWAAFTAAQPGVQRPILLRALRLLRNEKSSISTARAQTVRRYQGYLRQIEQLYADVPQSISGMRARDVGSLLEGLIGLIDTDQMNLAQYGSNAVDVVTAIATVRQPIDQIRASRHWTSQGGSSGYNNFQPNDLLSVIAHLQTITVRFPMRLRWRPG